MSQPNTTIDPVVADRVFRPKLSDKGILITIDGFDGSGKSTQIDGLAERFRREGREVVLTRQPTDWYRETQAVRHFHDEGGSAQRARLPLVLTASALERRPMLVAQLFQRLHLSRLQLNHLPQCLVGQRRTSQHQACGQQHGGHGVSNRVHLQLLVVVAGSAG